MTVNITRRWIAAPIFISCTLLWLSMILLRRVFMSRRDTKVLQRQLRPPSLDKINRGYINRGHIYAKKQLGDPRGIPCNHGNQRNPENPEGTEVVYIGESLSVPRPSLDYSGRITARAGVSFARYPPCSQSVLLYGGCSEQRPKELSGHCGHKYFHLHLQLGCPSFQRLCISVCPLE